MSCYPHDRITVKVTAKILSPSEITVFLTTWDRAKAPNDDENAIERIDRVRGLLADSIPSPNCTQRARIITLVNALAAAAVGCSCHIDEATAAEKLAAAQFLEGVAAKIGSPSTRELIAAVMTTPPT